MRMDRRALRRHLEQMGHEPVPPASPDFAVRTEERLRVQGPVTAVVDELAGIRARRRSWAPALVAAAAVTALLIAAPEGDDDVSLTTDGASASSSTSLVTPTTAVTPTTTAPAPVPGPAPPGPAVTTTTLVAAGSRPTTATSAPARGSTTTTAVPAPPSTAVATTTTTVPAVARLDLRCGVQWREALPFVTCTWSDPPDTAIAGWRAYRATGDGAKRVIWTSADPPVRSFVDSDVVPGTTYQYAVEALALGGRIVAKGGIVTVACCPP